MSETSRAVFLSYAHEDAAAAQCIADALRAAGVDVWYDQSELRGGDAWDASIRERVETCALFVPIISAHTQSRREGYFRLEWHLADERTHLMAEGTPFVLPVAIDDTRERGALVPKSFLGVQWTRLAHGEDPAGLVQRVRGLLATGSAMEAGRPRPAQSDSDFAQASTDKEHVAAPGNARHRFPLWATVALGVAVLAAGAYFALRPPAKETPDTAAAAKSAAETKASPAAPRNGAKSIAVIPFANRSTERENEFFTDGMHDDILTQLSRIRELRVTSRTSVEQYRATKKTLKQVGEELGVAYILEGSVQRAGNKVHVTGQLIRAATDEHLWAKNYDRDLTVTDIIAIQSELAQAIAGELKATISPQEKKVIENRPTENIAAYDLYLKARALRDSTLSAPEDRITLLKAAVQLDPKFSAAWALLGETYSLSAMTDYKDQASKVISAKAAIAQAVRLAPEATETLVAQARYLMRLERDYSRAIQLLERALSQSPNDARAFGMLATIARWQGRAADALIYMRKSASLDAGNINAVRQTKTMLAAGRRYDEEKIERRKWTDALPPSLTRSYEIAFLPYRASGSTREVEQFFSTLTDADAKSTEVLRLRRVWAMTIGDLTGYARLAQATPRPPTMDMALVLAAQGDLSAARAELSDTDARRTVLDQQPTNPWLWSELGEREALLGNKDEALRCARKAMELRPESVDAQNGPPHSASLAFVYAWTGDKDRAIAEYARLLRVPWSGLNVHEMKHHPAYHPLRGDPRFEALLNDPKNNEPLF